jgi:hypothetical protein
VTDGTNGIADVDVFAFNSSTFEGASAITDSGGNYSMSLPSGTYDFDFVPKPGSGFTSASQDDVEVSGATTVNQTLSQGNQISGTVTNAGTSDPVPNVEVHAFNKSTGAFGFAITGANGTYSLRVPSGTYEVDAFPPGGSGLAPALPVSVDVSSGNATQDFELDPGVTISGTVTEASGESRAAGDPIRGVAVDAFEFSTGNFGFGISNEAGEYSIQVAQGNYNLHAFPPPNSEYLPSSGIQVNASSGSATQNINLKKGSSVIGFVRDCGNTSTGVSDVEVLVFDRTNFQTPPTFTRSLVNGAFRIPLIDGDFEIIAFPPPGKPFTFSSSEFSVSGGTPSGTETTCSGSLPIVSSSGQIQIGLTGASGLSGVVYGDLNKNGTQDSGEVGLPNVGINAFPSSFSSGEPVKGFSSGGQPAFGFTDPSGKFFLALTDGTYDLMVFLEPGSIFVPPELGQLTVSTSGGTTTFTLDGNPITNLNIAAATGLIVKGKITASNGTTGIPRAGVNLWPAYDPSGIFDFNGGSFAETDKNGNYVLAVRKPTTGSKNLEFSVFVPPTSGNLPPPFLRLSLTSTGAFSIPTTVTDPFDGTSSSYSMPSEYSFSQSGGADTPATINARMQTGNTLSGVTYVDVARTANQFDNGTDTRVRNVFLVAFPIFDPGTSVDFTAYIPGFAQSDANGNYSMTLKAGKYEVTVDSFGFFDPETGTFQSSTAVLDPAWLATFPDGVLRVDVTEGDTTLNVQLANSTAFPGSVKRQDGTGLPCIPINAWVRPSGTTTPTGGWLGPPLTFANTDRNGNFNLNLPNGTFEAAAEIEFGGCFGPGGGSEIPPPIREEDPSRAPVNPAHKIVVVSGGAIISGNLNFVVEEGVRLTGIAQEEDRFGGGFIRGTITPPTFPLSFRQLVLFCGSPQAEVARGFTEFDGSFGLNVPKIRSNCKLAVEDWGFTGSTFRTLPTTPSPFSIGTTDLNLGTLTLRYIFIKGLLKGSGGQTINNGQIRAVDTAGNELARDFLFNRGDGTNFALAVPQNSGTVTLMFGTTSASPTVSVGTSNPANATYTVALAKVTGKVYQNSVAGGNEIIGVPVSIVDLNGFEVVTGGTSFGGGGPCSACTAGSFVSFDDTFTEVEGIYVPKGTFRVRVGGAFASGGGLTNGTFTIGNNEITNGKALGNLVMTLLKFSGNTADSTLRTAAGQFGLFVDIMRVDNFQFVTGFNITGSNPPPGANLGDWAFSLAPDLGKIRMTYFDNSTFQQRLVKINGQNTYTVGSSAQALTLTDGGVFDPFGSGPP